MNTGGHSTMSLQWMICFGDGGFEKLTVQEVLPIEERETNMTVVPGTPLHRAMEKGLYEESTETEKLEEIHELVRCLTNETIFMNEHASNLFHVQCRIPESKEKLLSYIRKFMEENDEKKLRQYRE